MPSPNLLKGRKPFQQLYKIKRKKPKKDERRAANMLEAQHEKWFFNLEPGYYAALQKEWIEHKLEIELTDQVDYDHWFNYFRTLSARKLQVLANTGMDVLDAEAYAALLRWRDIMENPHRIDKIHQTGLTNANPEKGVKSISQLAKENDRRGVLMATRDQIAAKLEKGAGARDTAALAREMTEIMTQIADYDRRAGPAKETVVGKLLADMPGGVKSKRPGKNGGGARNTSFKTRVTIKDVEG